MRIGLTSISSKYSTDVTDEWLHDESRIRIGKNILSNRLISINNLIDYDWLNLTEKTYKLKCKALLMA